MDGNSEIFHISKKYWSGNDVQFDVDVVYRIYNEHMLRFGFSHKQIQNLEFTQYFEKYLWPNYTPNVYENEREFIISICAIVNEKLSEKINAWDTFKSKPENFSQFFHKILQIILTPFGGNDDFDSVGNKKSLLEHIILIQFLNNCFLSLTEIPLIFEEIKYLLSMGMWTCLTENKLEEELAKNVEYRKKFKKILKSDSKTDPKIKYKREFLPKLLDKFIDILNLDNELKFDSLILRYLENCLILFINLDSMLVSRRYFNSVIDNKHLIVKAQNSKIIKIIDDSKLFFQLLEMLDFYVNFEIDEVTGSTLTDMELECRQRDRLYKLQKIAYKRFKVPMKELWMTNMSRLENGDIFHRILASQTEEDLRVLGSEMQIIPEKLKENYSKSDIIKMFCYAYKKRTSTLNRINNLALYPTEELIYDENSIPDGYYSMEENFAVPKLSVQYLSFHDYLMRNFDLFRLEASYEIKQDIEQCLSMMKPVMNEVGEVVCNGWSRMGLPIKNFQIVEIGQPEIGRNFPRSVRADVTMVINTAEHIRREWENLSKHDPCFLITVCPKLSINERYTNRELIAGQAGLVCVRGCEIEGLLDNDGKVISEEDKRAKLPTLTGMTRTWRLKLDPCQYNIDAIAVSDSASDVYSSFNIFMRRKPKENNFKAVLETIRDLMNDHCIVPGWLQDLLLGYDQPNAAHYSAMNSAYIQSQNWSDTFLDQDHLVASFPQYKIDIPQSNDNEFKSNLIRLKFPPPLEDKKLVPIEMHNPQLKIDTENRPTIQAEFHRPPIKLTQNFIDPTRHRAFDKLPDQQAVGYPGNQIRFTSTQVEAIRSGMQPGLTLVIGPPGTGKTDVATQIINNLYRNYPNQRTLIVTHSNQALNQLFEKIINLGIDERHLLRLGHGEEALETTKDFSKYGRVNYVLAKRLELLREVEQLSIVLGCIAPRSDHEDEPLYTCETSQHFLLSEVLPRWSTFLTTIDKLSITDYDDSNRNVIIDLFPFLGFFVPARFQSPESIRQLFPGLSFESDLEIARVCFRHILDLFVVLDDFRSFELMRNGLSRANSLLVQHARIIAMTCTHAALRRRDLIQLGFSYDNILIEEAAQILEIETFIPLLLQQPDQSNLNRLKRWVMIGDHNQLPPVIKNPVFQSYCNMSQSMFARLVKLGVPAVQLNAQGRSRSSLRRLYGWRYDMLEDLPLVINRCEYQFANPGFQFEFQLVDVGDFNGVGETEPTPHFVQNLGEAEFCVALYMYMRALGYPSEKISILTTYNGQKHLIRDIVHRRCAEIGFPSKVTTVDRFQGQQNDYIILSLVRTKTVGHLRDVRRLVVALSRARLGLYVFCRTGLFSQCRELQKSFSLLMERPTELALVNTEHYSFLEAETMRKIDQPINKECVNYIKNVHHMLGYIETIYSTFRNQSLKRKLEIKEPIDDGIDNGDSDGNDDAHDGIVGDGDKDEDVKKLKLSDE